MGTWNGRDDHGVLASIGSVGDANDNTMAEGFVDSFKTELIADRVWRTRSQLELAIVEYVGWFNTSRLLEALGDRPPAKFEILYAPRTETSIPLNEERNQHTRSLSKSARFNPRCCPPGRFPGRPAAKIGSPR
jgi:Integrase core domain